MGMNDLRPFQIEQKLLFVQSDFRPPDVLPGQFEIIFDINSTIFLLTL